MDGFISIFADFTALRRQAREKQDVEQKEKRARLFEIGEWYAKYLEPQLACATIPGDCEYRVSLSSEGTLTIVVTGLDSFHDITEITSVLSRLKGDGTLDSEIRTKPDIMDEVGDLTRKLTYWNYLGKWFLCIRVIATLGPEAQGCKVMNKIVSKKEYRSIEIDTAVEQTTFVCPGEAGYDDI